MDRAKQRQLKPDQGRSNVSLLSIVTVVAFVAAAVFAILILRGPRHANDAAPTPPRTAGIAQATSTALVSTATAAPTQSPGPTTPSVALEPTSAPPYLQANDPDVAAAVDGLLANYDGVYGVLVTKADGAVLYSKNSETPFVSASLYKLVLLADIYRKLDAGTLDRAKELTVLKRDFEPDDGVDSFFTEENVGQSFTIERLLFATGAYSSNVAAKMLLTQTDSQSLANETVLLGMTGTHLFVKPDQLVNWPPTAAPDSSQGEMETAVAFDVADASNATTNLTTPADMARFFQLLLRGDIVSKAASAEILGILKQQVIDDRFPVLLPDGAEMAHKTGNLDFVVHDVGIIYAPSGPVILIAMVEADTDDNIPTEVEQRLALIAYGDYNVPPLDYSTDSNSTPAQDTNAIDNAGATDTTGATDGASVDTSGETP
jgi:beta-lactamase class A